MQMQKLSSLEKTALPSFLFLVTAGEDGIAVFLTGAHHRSHLMKTPTNIYRVLNIPTSMPRNGTNAHTSTHVMCGSYDFAISRDEFLHYSTSRFWKSMVSVFHGIPFVSDHKLSLHSSGKVNIQSSPHIKISDLKYRIIPRFEDPSNRVFDFFEPHDL